MGFMPETTSALDVGLPAEMRPALVPDKGCFPSSGEATEDRDGLALGLRGISNGFAVDQLLAEQQLILDVIFPNMLLPF
ncbi:MAG TPA: hypothetical protein VK465_06320 [Fibrobacteria bacterium]|nr:hypothetical protein [Fibrobacteria bacterium]